MSNSAIVEEKPDDVKYAEEKYNEFLRAQTPKQALTELQHVSQLVHKLPDERVKEVIREVRESPDVKINVEGDYLAEQWVRRFVVIFRKVSGLLLFFSGVLFVAGFLCNWPFKLTFVISYILAAVGVEGLLVTLVLYWKQKLVREDESKC